MKYFYPAIFTCHEKEGIYSIEFPDLTGCQATANTIDIAVSKAREALGRSLMELEEKQIAVPLPSLEVALQRMHRGSHVCTIVVDMDEYRAYRAYQVKEAERDTLQWAIDTKKRQRSFFHRVFGTR